MHVVRGWLIFPSRTVSLAAGGRRHGRVRRLYGDIDARDHRSGAPDTIRTCVLCLRRATAGILSELTQIPLELPGPSCGRAQKRRKPMNAWASYCEPRTFRRCGNDSKKTHLYAYSPQWNQHPKPTGSMRATPYFFRISKRSETMPPA